MKAIKARPMRLGNLKRSILDAPLRKYAGLAAQQMERTAVNFRVVAPRFVAQTDVDDNGVFVGPADTPSGMIWFYLDRGTLVRYAVMTPDYQPGTSPGSFATSVAQGQTAFVDTSRPLPGIEPRRWSEMIANNLGPRFQADVLKSLEKRIKRLYG